MLVVTGLVGAATFFLLLFLVFPVSRLRAPWARQVPTLCLVAGVVVTALFCWALAVDSTAYPAIKTALFLLVSWELLSGCLLGILSLKQANQERREARLALGFVVLGALAGVLPFCLLSLVPFILGRGYLLTPDLAILSILFLPAGIAVAILRRQFLGIDLIVKRGAVPLVVWLALVALYGNLFHLVLGTSVTSGVLGLAIVAGTFPFLESRLRKACEQALFPDLYDYAQTLQQLTNEIVTLSGLAAVAEHILQRLGSLLGLEWAAIILQPANLPQLSYTWGRFPAEPDNTYASELGSSPPPVTHRDAVYSTIPLVSEGRVIGSLQLGPRRDQAEFSSDDEMLVATLVPMIATALRNGLLVHNLAEQVAALNEREQRLAALNLRLVTVQEEERARLALDLHDDPLQRTLLLARSINSHPTPAEVTGWRDALEEIAISLRAICSELRPPTLDDLGLVPALEVLVSDARARSDLAIELEVAPSVDAWRARLHPQCETTLYRVAQEGLSNCLKHAQASDVVVSLVRDEDRVRLSISDNGVGAMTYESNGGGGLGIVGMRERLRAWNGSLHVHKQSPCGTVLSAEIPLEGA
jgi:two-component system sensor histidine kinase ComP